MKIILVLGFLGLFAVFGTDAQQCAQFPDDFSSNACKFGDQEWTVGALLASCADVNANPFTDMSSQCYDLMLQDGKDCSYAVGSYYCSGLCPDCSTGIERVCESVCSNVEQKCPTLWQTTACRTSTCVADAICTNTPVSKGKVDDITGLDGGNNNSAGKPAITLPVVLFGLFALLVSSVLLK